MKNIWSSIKNVFLYIWQLPQNIIGLIMILVLGYDKKIITKNNNVLYISKKMSGGISLGKYSIISDYYTKKCQTNEDILNLDVSKHEALGHGTQSRYLGPLYLLVIGLPSIIWASIYPCKMFPYSKNGYYTFYTEKWADKLAKINRV